MERRAFTRLEIAFVVGVPLAWGLLLMFHPTGDTAAFYPVVSDEVAAWEAVHIGMMLFIPLMAGVVYLLLRGVGGSAARLSRWALVPFIVFYTAFETLVGTGTGIVVNEVNGLPAAEAATGQKLAEALGESAIPAAFSVIGSVAWFVAIAAAAVALIRQAHAPRSVAFLLALSALPIVVHEPPFGPIGLALFAAAVVIYVRSQAEARKAPVPAAQPRVA